MRLVDSGAVPATVEWVGEPYRLPLLFTKLHRPRVSSDLEHRQQLLRLLDANKHRPLTLIAAPAGYGKTTLASTWLQASGGVSAWVSLDEKDDDLVIFAGYLVAAVLGAFPAMQLKTQMLLQAAVKPSTLTLARYLVNDLEQIDEHFVLVLDDIHVVKEPAIFELLTELLRHPLDRLHLVLIGRRDPPLPIASLRARGQIMEVRARDLAFSIEETGHFLGKMLGREIPAEIAAEWTQRTEGWVTALRLAALSLHHRDRLDDLKAGVSGGIGYLQEYLLADVFAHLPPARKEWLLKTSLLERFSAPLCEAVCQPPGDGSHSDGAESNGLTGKEFVRWLQDDNLFLVTLDDQGKWFRFHNLFKSLLRDLLHEQLTSVQVAEARARASAWCAENGLMYEGVGYALATGDTGNAIALLVHGRDELLNSENWMHRTRWQKLVPAEVTAQHPLLLNAGAFLAWQMGDSRTLSAIKRQSTALLEALPYESEERRVAQAELTLLQPLHELHPHQLAGAIDEIRQSLALLPPQALYIRSVALANMAFGLQLDGRPEESIGLLREALGKGELVGTINARAMILNSLCTILWMQGDLNGLLAAAANCVRVAEQTRRPYLMSLGHYHLGAAHYLRNEWAQAEPHLLALVEDCAIANPSYLALGAFVLALIRQGQGRETEAAHVIETISSYLLDIGHDPAHTLTIFFKAELALRAGRIPEARQFSRGGWPEQLPYKLLSFYPFQLTQPKLLLAQGTLEALAEARSQLERLRVEVAGLHIDHACIDVLALLALVHDALGESAPAFRRLREALLLGEPGGFIRNFADLGSPMTELLTRLRRDRVASGPTLPYLDRVLSATRTPAQRDVRSTASLFAPTSVLDQHVLTESLTERESRILALLATDLTPEQMARELSVSVATVRTHIKNIYAKLCVHSRCEATQAAAALGLL